ncbi:elongation factor P maturation arginine rhamnosyltransferase EarP [Shewanella waksmanii]|uniref:elongation factor P maturation arginine rhamnosyltransferase EarP n=1 Tax=Shewanella waksmanii TaxID=213783 RepID=UPI0037355ED7
MANETASHWDIFCSVVDNYGDIGVCWRLAKQLSTEYQLEITLWVDDLISFKHIQPQVDAHIPVQQVNGITIHHWTKPMSVAYKPGSALIEAFACELPDDVKSQLVSLKTSELPQPVWLNLEYLSAEQWVDDCHALPSMQASGLKKWFFFPGFTPKTGGLICEKNLFTERDNWQADITNKAVLLEALGVRHYQPSDQLISVFSYESEALVALCKHWQQAKVTTRLLVPMGRSLNSLKPLFNPDGNPFEIGQHWQVGNVHLHILPVTDQQDYDRLLWSCDVNIVRGEDSFLRAQWAAKPFIWHIYPQEDDYHLVKLEAFYQHYCKILEPQIASTWQNLCTNFNTDNQLETVNDWRQFETHAEKLKKHAKIWPINAIDDEDLATRLVHFVKNR